ncbi:unnamed protein product [Allacma fusca]|uniref:Uncharacterized protein n=1 Tax=Allacma fusca TaxID=39272 RepID=A0A8J2PCM2_9HEXA|nr:unnamed protein product [Allacma fusca]
MEVVQFQALTFTSIKVKRARVAYILKGLRQTYYIVVKILLVFSRDPHHSAPRTVDTSTFQHLCIFTYSSGWVRCVELGGIMTKNS